MAIQGIGAAGISGIQGVGAPQKARAQQFGKTLKDQLGSPQGAAPRGETAPLTVQRAEARPRIDAGKSQVHGASRATQVAAPQKALEPARMIDQVAAAQKRMDSVLELAQSGKSFTPAELLSLQTQMYRASQELDLAGKVIEKATGGVKQILQTQI
jgi:flagellar hook-basal body complex protein FliE